MAFTPHQLRELSIIFGLLGNIVSFGVFLAPLPTFWRIYKKKSTEGFQAIPYSVALFSAMLLLYYAFVKEGDTTLIITINTIGVIIQGFYLTIYMIYAPKKAKIYTAKLLGLFNVVFYGLIVVVTLAFFRGLDHHTLFSRGGHRETVVGWICAVFSVCVFAAPLSVMRMVIRTKSVEFMPFWLSFSLTLCAIMWFFYGFLIHDHYIALPNILGFAFGIAQMLLYLIFKDSNKNKGNAINEMEDIKPKPDMTMAKLETNYDQNYSTDQENNRKSQVIQVVVEGTVGEGHIVNNEENNEDKGHINNITTVTATFMNVDENTTVKAGGKVANGKPPRGCVYNV